MSVSWGHSGHASFFPPLNKMTSPYSTCSEIRKHTPEPTGLKPLGDNQGTSGMRY